MGNKSKSSASRAQQRPAKEEYPISKQPEQETQHLTHGFWLQQYSWLHSADNQPAAQQQRAAQASGVAGERRPQRLMARWTSSLMRTFAGLSASHESVHQPPASKKAHSETGDSRPQLAGGKRSPWPSGDRPAACYSALHLPSQAAGDEDKADSSTSLSPYKRLARALRSPSRQKCRPRGEQQPASCPQKKSRLMRLAHSCSSSAARANQPAAQRDERHQSSGGLLSSILISPLFRSKTRCRQQPSGDDQSEPGSRPDKRQKSIEPADRSQRERAEIRAAGSGAQQMARAAASTECGRLGIEEDENYDRSTTATSTDAAGAALLEPARTGPESARGYLPDANANEARADEQPVGGDQSLLLLSSLARTEVAWAGPEQPTVERLTAAESSLLPLIQATTTGGSSSSLASSSMLCFDLPPSAEATPRHSARQRTTTFAAAGNQLEDSELEQQQQQYQRDNENDANLDAAGREQVSKTMGARDPEQPRAASQPMGSIGAQSPGQSGHTSSLAGPPAATPSGGVGGALKNNFKKLIKRQQSVDSYRMARDLKNKLRRQNESRNKHQSNEAIKTRSVGDEQQPTNGGGPSSRQARASVVSRSRKLSILADLSGALNAAGSLSHSIRQQQQQSDTDQGQLELRQAAAALRISIDPYAKPGTFELPGSLESAQRPPEVSTSTAAPTRTEELRQEGGEGQREKPTPPNTLSLIPGGQVSFSASSFSGCITPTYPTHHLPSPKYVSPSMLAANSKKYSNASTISSSLADESMLATANCHSSASSYQGRTMASCAANQPLAAATTTPTNNNNNSAHVGESGERHPQSDAENASASDSASPMRLSKQTQQHQHQQQQQHLMLAGLTSASSEQLAAARRADLAEHIYDNKCGLGEDMKFLASLPELCDITFLVGETREPVCAVKSVLAARSRVFCKILFGNRMRAFSRQQQQQQSQRDSEAELMFVGPAEATGQTDRRSSSPRPAARLALASNRSSSPVASARSVSPKQQQPAALQHWSVTSDASGLSQAAALELNHRQQQQQRRESLERSAGRSSVVSTGTSLLGRESAISQASQTSQGSQQPLIIGPGQSATPAPIQLAAPNASSAAKRNKRATLARDAVVGASASAATENGSGPGGSASGSTKQLDRQHSREGGASRLSRMFMKRASDPSIKQQQQQQQQQLHEQNYSNGSNQNYLDKMSSSQMSTTMIIEEFEPDVFRQLIEYIHTGCVLLQARTLLGLLNAADYYGLEQLRKACLRFVSCCITVDTVCSLLSTAERYIQYKCTKSIVQKVLEFVDTHADEIFKLNAFGLLPEHVVRLILARDGLQADEQAKYNGVYTWCEHYCRSYELTNIADVMRNFLDFIQFHKIPTNILLSEIYPTHTVPDTIFLSALAYQADPKNLEPQPLKARRMTLPNPTFHKDQSGDELDVNDDRSAVAVATRQQPQSQQQQRQDTIGSRTGRPVAGPSFSSSWSRESKLGHKSIQQQQQHQHHHHQPQQPNQRQQSRDSVSSSGQQSLVQQASALRTTSVGRKSLGGHQAAERSAQRSRKGSIAQVSISGVMRKLSIKRRAGRGDSLADGGANSRRPSVLSKQQSLLSSTANSSGGPAADDPADPLRVGQQILDAYLEQQRQRELEEANRKSREAEQRAAEQAASTAAASATTTAAQQPPPAEQTQQTAKPIVKVSLSSRKSFKDFKHISRRIFMRHSSSNKMVQQRRQSPVAAAGLSAGSSCSSSSVNLGSPAASPLQQQQQLQTKDSQPATKRRNVLKIKRSETVFETSASGPSSRLSHQLSANLLGR